MADKTKYKYVEVYSKNDYEKDKQSFTNAEKQGKVDWSAFRRLMVRDIITNSELIETGYIGDIKLEDAQYALGHPKKNWRMILAISEQLMRISPHYYRLNMLYSNMALFNWGIDMYDIKDNINIDYVKRTYNTLVAKLENMNLKHEFLKIMRCLPWQDLYCGLIVENSSDFFIQKLNLNICKLFQIQDGLYDFKIDLAAINPKEFNSYPDYVQQAYSDFIDGKSSSNWYVPPADKQICMKFNSQWIYPYPILISLVSDILDLDVYKKLKLQSARTDNYKAIMVKVPIDESTVDKPLLTPETLSIFAEINRESMNNDIGLIHTLGSDGEAINFKDSNNTRNNVSDAVEELYNASGESKELYNGSSSATALTFSIENSSGFVYNMYRQFERWVNRYIKVKKYNKNTFKFHFYLLDTTIFNRDTVTNRYKDAATLGLPVVDKFLASIDMTPSRVMGAYIIHNDIFDYYNKFKPLMSSYNTSTDGVSDGESGRPTNESQGKLLSEEGEETSDNDKNIR